MCGCSCWFAEKLCKNVISGIFFSVTRKGEFAGHSLGRCKTGMRGSRDTWYPRCLVPETLTLDEAVRKRRLTLLSTRPCRPPARRPHVLHCRLYFEVHHVQAYMMTPGFHNLAIRAARRPLQSPSLLCSRQNVLHCAMKGGRGRGHLLASHTCIRHSNNFPQQVTPRRRGSME